MKFRPLHDRVVVRRIDAEEKTKGGIIIPDTAKEKPQEGEIVAVGPGARDESGKLVALDVKTGDKRTLPSPVSALHPNGKEAVSFDFARQYDAANFEVAKWPLRCTSTT